MLSEKSNRRFDMVRLNPKPASDAADVIKAAALRLFAARGVDGVTVREIATEAGQKNHAAVGYHFGSKEALIRELIIDGARNIDAERNALLDELEARRKAPDTREICEVLVYPSVNPSGPDAEEECYNRFIVLLGMSHREFLMDVLAGKLNSGYLRCLEHLKRLMFPLPDHIVSQRLVFVETYIGSVLSARESLLSDQSREHPTWQSPRTLRHFIDTLIAIIEAPYPSEKPDPVFIEKEKAV